MLTNNHYGITKVETVAKWYQCLSSWKRFSHSPWVQFVKASKLKIAHLTWNNSSKQDLNGQQLFLNIVTQSQQFDNDITDKSWAV